MTSATITPIVRELSWNVNFIVGEKATPSDRFAGIYQVPGEHMVTFRDVCHELWLCFKGILGEQGGNSSDNPWANIAFALYDSPESNLSSETQGCAHHFLHVKRRYDPRYIPYDQRISDPNLALMPLQREGFSHSERSQSSSPIKESFDSDEEFEDILAPESVREDLARQTTTSFKDKVLSRGDCCVVSRKGKSWCSAIGISPTVEACHIVPQLHYDLYPVEQTEDNKGKHLMAWTRTWDFGNGILLRKDLRKLFDARAFSIRPQDGTIRVFLPSDELIEFNGKKALLHDDIDRQAILHHYEMCCIENMSALLPDIGVGSPISKKRQRTPQDDLAEEAEAGLGGNKRGYKRRRFSECQVSDAESPPQAYYHSADEDVDGYDQYITPANSREFLEIVNWELRRFQDRRLAG
ncbi:hypothetical protein F4680DRAFT_450582 [Xylaria scruposa]|nr:hypothetical protein F4680DRAFT_450582 [Xylaria scruposa]